MRVVFFIAGGDIGFRALEAVDAHHEVVAVVRPGFGMRRRVKSVVRKFSAGHRDMVSVYSKTHRIPVLGFSAKAEKRLARKLMRLRPDVFCIATFPHILGRNLLCIPPCGALNLHGSLLPRHRGPNPYFWTYYHDDEKTGVTVHFATAKADAGPIVRQLEWPLARGLPISDLHAHMSLRGAEEMRLALDAISGGEFQGRPQDPVLVTEARRILKAEKMIRWQEWDVERVHHFICGTYPFFVEPLVFEDQEVKPGRPLGFDATEVSAAPGLLEKASWGWKLYCKGGYVRLAEEGSGRGGGAS